MAGTSVSFPRYAVPYPRSPFPASAHFLGELIVLPYYNSIWAAFCLSREEWRSVNTQRFTLELSSSMFYAEGQKVLFFFIILFIINIINIIIIIMASRFSIQLTWLSLAVLSFVPSAAALFPFLMGCCRFWGWPRRTKVRTAALCPTLPGRMWVSKPGSQSLQASSSTVFRCFEASTEPALRWDHFIVSLASQGAVFTTH